MRSGKGLDFFEKSALFTPVAQTEAAANAADAAGAAGGPMASMRAVFSSVSSSVSSATATATGGGGGDKSTSSLSRAVRFKWFVMLAVAAGCCFLLSLTFLPLAPIRPHKFALLFTMGSILAMAAMAMLRGPADYARSLLQRDKLVFTATYVGTLLLTLYAALIAKSYVLVILSSALQFGVLGWQTCGLIPGGGAGRGIMLSSARRLLPI